MKNTDISIQLDTSGIDAAGVDLRALQADLQAEIEKFAEESGLPVPTPEAVPAPQGAQGMDQMVHWLMHLASEPAMAKVYARMLFYALNEITKAAKGQNADSGDTAIVRIKAFGKDIALPVATAVIDAAIDEVKGQ